jgi:16S rRNA (guanine966-N2)-methyltransferase
MVRITGGDLRGRRLQVPKTGVRPTTGKVREATFSILGDVSGARVLDLFCGSGALAIEALSRGAAEATLVDTQPAVARSNLEALGLTGRARTVRSDTARFLRRAEPGSYDLVLCDPPYTLAADLVSGLDLLLPDAVTRGGRVVIETSAREPLTLSMDLIKERDYGDTLIRVYGADR